MFDLGTIILDHISYDQRRSTFLHGGAWALSLASSRLDSRSHFHRYRMRRHPSCNSTSTQSQSATLSRPEDHADNCGPNLRPLGMLVGGWAG